MGKENNLQRFTDAQASAYPVALAEVKKGRKQSHWMWYIFPQIQGLGLTEISKLYAIKDIHEAEEFLQHPVLGSRLVSICRELLQLPGSDAHSIFGSPDDLKLRSSMTLFLSVPEADKVFQLVLDKFYKGAKDEKTLSILAKQR